ncbi:MAG: HlyD family efflux transporter periplasmic adaptor subunit [Planctomycetes bacterium]|nr:HlyD family efflux transporter periplasmic adaptor subunit [Planctomycetota bacterium]
MSNFKSKLVKRAFILGLVALVCIVFSAFSGPGNGDELSGDTVDKIYTVTRGEFNITVLMDGTLDAIKRHDLRCDVRWNDKIISQIAKDGTYVKKGDVIIEIDPEPREKDRERHAMELDENQKELAVALEDISMIRASNLSSISAAADRYRTAQEAYQKYMELEYDQKRRTLFSEIDKAKISLATMEQTLSDAKDSRSSSQSMEQAELDKLDAAVEQAESKVNDAAKALRNAEDNLRVFRQYDHPQKERSLTEAVNQARLSLQQSVVQARGKDVQAERKVNWLKKKVVSAQKDLDNAIKDLECMTITAPVDGIVSFGNPHRPHWREPKEFKVGTQLNYQEIVATIPDLSKFQVTIDVPEEYRSRVKLGQPAMLRSPAIPNLKMKGEVAEIAPMAEHVISWDKGSPKIYRTQISTDDADKRMMPGMTVKVEIIVETVKDAVFVPVEAVYNREGKTYAVLDSAVKPQEVEVKTGRSSIHFVEILEGLKADDKVQLFRRAGSGK